MPYQTISSIIQLKLRLYWNVTYIHIVVIKGYDSVGYGIALLLFRPSMMTGAL